MFVVFYAVEIVYICIFMTCFTSYCLCGTLLDPWNVCIYAHMCVIVNKMVCPQVQIRAMRFVTALTFINMALKVSR
jgi:hypothetical protein